MNNSVKPDHSLIQTLSIVTFVVISVLLLGFAIGASIAAVCVTRKKPLLTCFRVKTSPIDEVPATNNVCTCGNGVAAVGSACTDDGLEVCASCDNGYYRLFQGPKRSLH